VEAVVVRGLELLPVRVVQGVAVTVLLTAMV